MTTKRGKIELGWGKAEQPVPAPTTPAKAPPPAATPAPASTPAEPAKPRARKPKGAGAEVGINLRLSPEAWTALGVLAAKQRRAKQDLLLEALDMVLERYGEEPVARKTMVP